MVLTFIETKHFDALASAYTRKRL